MPDFFSLACEEAERGMLAGDGGPFGAVVVKDGRIIGKGHNMVLASFDSTAHAEIVAIRRAEQAEGTHDLSGCEIYTTCFPCPMCLGAILWARISKVHYGSTTDEAAETGFDDKTFYEAIQNRESTSLVSLEHHDNPRCRNLFRQWMVMEHKKLY